MRRSLNRRSLFSARKWALFIECGFALVLARVGLRCMELSRLSGLGCRIAHRLPCRTGKRSGESVRAAAACVDRIAQFMHGMDCLPQALATQWLTARRKSCCTLHVGVARRENEFRSHAWTSFDGATLTGGRGAAVKYREMVRLEGTIR